MIEQLHNPALFNDLARIHHNHIIGHFSNNSQIMGNQQNGHSAAFFKFPQHIENLGLDGHIQRGSRLIGNQQLRVAGNGNGNHDPLKHAAA
ncbi:hypothetical protein D3C73_623240 [compost metagenome]